MKKILIFISPIATYFASFSISFAATASSCNMSSVRNFKDLVINLISCFLNPTVTLLVSISILVFLFGVFKIIKSQGEGKETGKEFMFWGIIGIFVIISLWGLVNILQNTFVLSNDDITPRSVNINFK